MNDFPYLSAMIIIPVLGALLIMMIRGKDEEVAQNAKWTALWASLPTLGLALFMFLKFDAASSAFQFVEQTTWFKPLDIKYHVGIDGISMFFVLLSAFLTPFCILAAWNMKTRVKEFMAAFLILETLMIGTFAALDTMLFYVFFEAVLIPMFLIIGIWGGARRVYASYKFFLYTLLGSVLMLLAFLYMYCLLYTSPSPRDRG